MKRFLRVAGVGLQCDVVAEVAKKEVFAAARHLSGAIAFLLFDDLVHEECYFVDERTRLLLEDALPGRVLLSECSVRGGGSDCFWLMMIERRVAASRVHGVCV